MRSIASKGAKKKRSSHKSWLKSRRQMDGRKFTGTGHPIHRAASCRILSCDIHAWDSSIAVRGSLGRLSVALLLHSH